MILHLGVDDIPYKLAIPQQQTFKKSQGRKKKAVSFGNTTTVDVATILEKQYHIMQTFFDRNVDTIGEEFAESLGAQLADLLQGAPVSARPFLDAESTIKTMFAKFLDSKQMDGTPKVPTQAARDGVNHRLKHPYAKGNPARPSFVDTGTYEDSFRAWIET